MGRHHHKEHRRPAKAGVVGGGGDSDHAKSVGRSGKSFPSRSTTPLPPDPGEELPNIPSEWTGTLGKRARNDPSPVPPRSRRPSYSIPSRAATPVPDIAPLFNTVKNRARKRPFLPPVKPDKLPRQRWMQPHPFMRPNASNAIFFDQWLAFSDQAFPGDIMFVGSLLLTELWLAIQVMPAELWDSLQSMICSVLTAKYVEMPSSIPAEVAAVTVEHLWSFLRTVRFSQLDKACQQANIQIVPTQETDNGELPDLLDEGFFKKQDMKAMTTCRYLPTVAQRSKGVPNRGLDPPIEDAIPAICWLTFFGARCAVSCVAHIPAVQCSCPQHVRMDPCVHLRLPDSKPDETFNLARSVATTFLQDRLQMPVNSSSMGHLNKLGLAYINRLVRRKSLMSLSLSFLSKDGDGAGTSTSNNEAAPRAATVSQIHAPVQAPSSHKLVSILRGEAATLAAPPASLAAVGFVSKASKKSKPGRGKIRKPLPEFKPPIEEKKPETAVMEKTVSSQPKITTFVPPPDDTPSSRVSNTIKPENTASVSERSSIAKIQVSQGDSASKAEESQRAGTEIRPPPPSDVLPKNRPDNDKPGVPKALSKEPRSEPLNNSQVRVGAGTLDGRASTPIDRVLALSPLHHNVAHIRTRLVSPDYRRKTSCRSLSTTSQISIDHDMPAPRHVDTVDLWTTYHVMEDRPCLITLHRDALFDQLLEQWTAYIVSETAKFPGSVIPPHRFMFVWKGRPLRLLDTPGIVGMKWREDVSVFDCMDVSLAVQCHEAGLCNEIMQTIVCRELIRMQTGNEPDRDARALSRAIAKRYQGNPLLREEEIKLAKINQSLFSCPDSLGDVVSTTRVVKGFPLPSNHQQSQNKSASSATDPDSTVQPPGSSTIAENPDRRESSPVHRPPADAVVSSSVVVHPSRPQEALSGSRNSPLRPLKLGTPVRIKTQTTEPLSPGSPLRPLRLVSQASKLPDPIPSTPTKVNAETEALDPKFITPPSQIHRGLHSKRQLQSAIALQSEIENQPKRHSHVSRMSVTSITGRGAIITPARALAPPILTHSSGSINLPSLLQPKPTANRHSLISRKQGMNNVNVQPDSPAPSIYTTPPGSLISHTRSFMPLPREHSENGYVEPILPGACGDIYEPHQLPPPDQNDQDGRGWRSTLRSLRSIWG